MYKSLVSSVDVRSNLIIPTTNKYNEIATSVRRKLLVKCSKTSVVGFKDDILRQTVKQFADLLGWPLFLVYTEIVPDDFGFAFGERRQCALDFHLQRFIHQRRV